MKALTLTQPWASLVAIGAKSIETRGWRTSYRGPLAIHAAKGFPKDAVDCLDIFVFFGAFRPDHAEMLKSAGVRLVPNACKRELAGYLPRGAVIATCQLTACTLISQEFEERLTNQERAFGNYDAGRYAWILGDIKALPEPIPAKGALSLWEWKP
jgi:hypothetical protein